MLPILIAVAVVALIAAGVWLTRGSKHGPYSGDSTLLDEKARQLDNAFRERPPKDY